VSQCIRIFPISHSKPERKTPKTIISSQAATNSHIRKSILNSHLYFVSFSYACKTIYSISLLITLASYQKLRKNNFINSLKLSHQPHTRFMPAQYLTHNGKLNLESFFILFFYQFPPINLHVSAWKGVDRSPNTVSKGAQIAPSSTRGQQQTCAD